jgi:hypothetical protein
MFWGANLALFATGAFNLSTTAELLSVVSVVLMVLTLLAVFLIVQAPRGGVWFGLAMQAIVGLHAFVLFFVFTNLLGAVELALAVITALCLAAAAQNRSRP